MDTYFGINSLLLEMVVIIVNEITRRNIEVFLNFFI